MTTGPRPHKGDQRVFRIGDEVGPDYMCSSCKLTGHRLWRKSHIFLTCIDLLCAVCAERDQERQIAEYAHFSRPEQTTIGNLLPARATPEGDTFWGHTSGDVAWWYRLPMYQDIHRELARVRLERDNFQQLYEYEIDRWMKERTTNRAKETR